MGEGVKSTRLGHCASSLEWLFMYAGGDVRGFVPGFPCPDPIPGEGSQFSAPK
jgi:hypothetical protein